MKAIVAASGTLVLLAAYFVAFEYVVDHPRSPAWIGLTIMFGLPMSVLVGFSVWRWKL